MNDVIVQFARLWGQREAWRHNAKDEDVSDMLMGYDSEELLMLLQDWADEFMSNDELEDTVEFFENKIEEMYVKESLEFALSNAVDRSGSVKDNNREQDFEIA